MKTTNDPLTLSQMFSMQNLIRAWESVSINRAAPGIDGVTVEEFSRNTRDRLSGLQSQLLSGGYRPQPYIAFSRPKKNGGQRELVNGTVRDKVVARAAANELVRRLDRHLMPQSYAYRPHKGALKAVAAVDRHYRQASHAVRADVEDFFDTMDHGILHARLIEMGVDQPAADLLVACAQADRFDGVAKRSMKTGVPQGSPLAPVLSNLYLHSLDCALNTENFAFVRYADDLLVLAGTPDEANGALVMIQQHLQEIQLSVSIEKTRVYPVAEGFLFLGFLFTPEGRTASHEARQRLSEKMELPPYDDETEKDYLKRLTTIRRGWTNYFGTDSAAPSPQESITAPFANPEGKGNESPTASITEAPLMEALAEAAQLKDAGRFQDAIRKLQILLNDDSLPPPVAIRHQALLLLADLFKNQGLDGAAARCRQSAGLKPEPMLSDPLKVTSFPYDAKDVERWMDLFGKGADPVARQYVDASGRSGYRPASKNLTPEYLRDHWAGKHTLAVPVFTTNDKVPFALLDLDITRRIHGQLNAAALENLRQQLRDDAVGLADTAHRAGVDGVIEDSGCKGYHLWFLFHAPINAGLALSFMQALCRVAGDPPEGTHREFFPNSSTPPPDGTGNRIKLPLGIHRLTRNRCLMLNSDGSSALPTDQSGFFRIRNSTQQLKTALEQWNRFHRAPQDTTTAIPQSNASDCTDAVISVYNGCGVLRALTARATETGTLTHYERTILRGILAPLGEPGILRAHQILKSTENYNFTVTDRMLRAAPAQPLGCTRIREILGTRADEAGCNCRFKPGKGDYAHPLRHLTAIKKKKPHPTNTSEPAPLVDSSSSDTSPNQPLELLIEEYHQCRMRLLNLQQQITLKTEAQPTLLPFGTLKSLDGDPDLKHWVIEL